MSIWVLTELVTPSPVVLQAERRPAHTNRRPSRIGFIIILRESMDAFTPFFGPPGTSFARAVWLVAVVFIVLSSAQRDPARPLQGLDQYRRIKLEIAVFAALSGKARRYRKPCYPSDFVIQLDPNHFETKQRIICRGAFGHELHHAFSPEILNGLMIKKFGAFMTKSPMDEASIEHNWHAQIKTLPKQKAAGGVAINFKDLNKSTS